MIAHEAVCLHIIHLFGLLMKIEATSHNYRFERQIGSAIVLPPCVTSASISSSMGDITTILFKADSGELLTMNGKLVSSNPRLFIKNFHSSELAINSIELLDEGQYECRSDEIINYILHLVVVNSSTVHLNVLEGSNITLQCARNGMWIIEETRRGGPIRTQYTSELVLNNLHRHDNRFHKIICSTRDGLHKREYVIDIMYKPAVKVTLSIRRSIMCIICAHPLPYRIRWWVNTRQERDDTIHQSNINQSCIAQQFTFLLKQDYDATQIITCEAENKHGIGRDTFNLGNSISTINASKYVVQKSLMVTDDKNTSTTKLLIPHEASCCDRIALFKINPILMYLNLLFISQHITVV